MTVTNGGAYDNIVDGIPGTALPGSYGGLQGEDEGQSNDFQLADGTVLQQPLTTAELYGEYANSWRVSQATSLFDYPTGEDTADFTDTNFPADAVTLADLPASVVSAGGGAGRRGRHQSIRASRRRRSSTTSPPAIQLHHLGGSRSRPGDADHVANVTPAAATPALAVSAVAQSVTAAASGATPVTFDAYLTAPETSDTVVDYTVVAAGAGYFDAACVRRHACHPAR